MVKKNSSRDERDFGVQVNCEVVGIAPIAIRQAISNKNQEDDRRPS